ncbi:MAG: hypothetical protein GOVbin1630_43 [Prokaryotic dsDNA virus sp.]|nr:MAG: hypothetical protein GOVbin1630_43 [Prokaryotic dsDNA virus sp.]|tara:strand:+ start:539 stop:793 length:255 start_codon:yes stop_codon:yes gene_type:complete
MRATIKTIRKKAVVEYRGGIKLYRGTAITDQIMIWFSTPKTNANGKVEEKQFDVRAFHITDSDAAAREWNSRVDRMKDMEVIDD